MRILVVHPSISCEIRILIFSMTYKTAAQQYFPVEPRLDKLFCLQRNIFLCFTKKYINKIQKKCKFCIQKSYSTLQNRKSFRDVKQKLIQQYTDFQYCTYTCQNTQWSPRNLKMLCLHVTQQRRNCACGRFRAHATWTLI